MANMMETGSTEDLEFEDVNNVDLCICDLGAAVNMSNSYFSAVQVNHALLEIVDSIACFCGYWLGS
jgi:hypothetical protein